MEKTSAVYFTGRWSDEERETVEAAARLVEKNQPYDPLVARLGCPWACSHLRLRGREYYVAYWLRRPGEVIRARSAADLARQIRTAC